jgi:chromosome segregation ATPase
MLFPKEKQTVSDSSGAAQGDSGSGVKIAILFGAVLALVGASVYLFYQLSQVRDELNQTRDSLSAEILKLNEASSVSTATSRRTTDALKEQVEKYRAQAAQLSGQAKVDATAHADQLAARLERIQQEQGKQVAAVTNEVSAVKSDTAAANTKIGEVSSEVGNVKTDVAQTKSELEKTIADLKSTRGDLGVQSGLIATNGKELAALKALGERNYTEFKIAKTKQPQKVGDISVRLEKADPKHNRYTIIVVADDKTVEKKDKTINEPVQFLLSKATQPYELVVNDVKKDLIVGYVASPKVQTTRN